MLDDNWVIVDHDINLETEKQKSHVEEIKTNIEEEEISWTGQRWRKYSDDSLTIDVETKEESEQCSKKQEWTGEMWRKYV